jgi:hypothetical protein
MDGFGDDEEVSLNLMPEPILRPAPAAPRKQESAQKQPVKAATSVASKPLDARTPTDDPSVKTHAAAVSVSMKRERPSDPGSTNVTSVPRNSDSSASQPTKSKKVFPPSQHTGHAVSAVYPVHAATARSPAVATPLPVSIPPFVPAARSIPQHAAADDWTSPVPAPAQTAVTGRRGVQPPAPSAGAADVAAAPAPLAGSADSGALLVLDTGDDDVPVGGGGGGGADFASLGLDSRIVAKLTAPSHSDAAGGSGKHGAATAAPAISAASGGISRGHFRDGFGLVRPTRVQRLMVPRALAGRNLLIKSETGSGKTLAFLLPVLQVRGVETAL